MQRVSTRTLSYVYYQKYTEFSQVRMKFVGLTSLQGQTDDYKRLVFYDYSTNKQETFKSKNKDGLIQSWNNVRAAF